MRDVDYDGLTAVEAGERAAPAAALLPHGFLCARAGPCARPAQLGVVYPLRRPERKAEEASCAAPLTARAALGWNRCSARQEHPPSRSRALGAWRCQVTARPAGRAADTGEHPRSDNGCTTKPWQPVATARARILRKVPSGPTTRRPQSARRRGAEALQPQFARLVALAARASTLRGALGSWR